MTVSSPDLAKALRKAGVFSGKVIKGSVPEFVVECDAEGFAIHAGEACHSTVSV